VSRDVLSVDLRTLIPQAEAVAVQIRVTPGLEEPLRRTALPAPALASRLEEVAAEARETAIRRALAEDDVDRAQRAAEAALAEVQAWRSDLIQELRVLLKVTPGLEPELQGALTVLAYRPLRVTGTAAWLCRAAPVLSLRAAGLEALMAAEVARQASEGPQAGRGACAAAVSHVSSFASGEEAPVGFGCPLAAAAGCAAGGERADGAPVDDVSLDTAALHPGEAVAGVAEKLRRAGELGVRLQALLAALPPLEAARAEWGREIAVQRRAVQDRLRQARRGWELAQARDPEIPDLDLALVRAAAATTGRRPKPDEA
jgi:hypothetical protein